MKPANPTTSILNLFRFETKGAPLRIHTNGFTFQNLGIKLRLEDHTMRDVNGAITDSFHHNALRHYSHHENMWRSHLTDRDNELSERLAAFLTNLNALACRTRRGHANIR